MEDQISGTKQSHRASIRNAIDNLHGNIKELQELRGNANCLEEKLIRPKPEVAEKLDELDEPELETIADELNKISRKIGSIIIATNVSIRASIEVIG